MNIEIEDTAPAWNQEYALLDSGDGYKVEKMGTHTLLRPEPQAIWNMHHTFEHWQKKTDAYFIRDKQNPEKGSWHVNPGTKDPWILHFEVNKLPAKAKLSFSSFKHIGIFPEQISNWKSISTYIQNQKGRKLSMMNLFAYTGVASCIAAMQGVEVTHVDSIKQVLNWANENKKINHIEDIKWMAEDALKYIQREQRRGHTYDIILMDPPAYGRGPNGEKWILEEKLNELLTSALAVLKPSNACLILNQYSMGMSPTLAYTHLNRLGANPNQMSMHELCTKDPYGKILPLGTCVRYFN